MTSNRGMFTFGLVVALVAGVSNAAPFSLGAPVAPILTGCCKAHPGTESSEGENAGDNNASAQQGEDNFGTNDENAGGNEQNADGDSGSDDANGGGEGGNNE